MRKKAVAVPAIAVIMTVLIIASYAWFTKEWNSENSKLGFTADNIPMPQMSMWMFDSKDYDGADKNNTWVEKVLTAEKDGYLIPGVTGSVSGSAPNESYIFNLDSLHVGTVDNLVQLKEDNKVYFRVKLNTDTNGKSIIKLSMNFNDINSPAKVYSESGKLVNNNAYSNSSGVNSTVIAELAKINGKTPFLSYSTCISTQVLAPSDAAFKNLTFSSDTLFGTASEINPDGNAETSTGAATTAQTNPPLSGDYYLYIRVTPNLPSFTESSRVLHEYMPCVILFGVTMGFEVY